MMRVGLAYDLQTDPHDGRQVEFDPPQTIERLCAALAAPPVVRGTSSAGNPPSVADTPSPERTVPARSPARIVPARSADTPSVVGTPSPERTSPARSQELGHEVVRLGNAADLLASRTWIDQVDLVFNIAEGSHGRNREAWVPTLLELLHVPYVGSDALALSLGLDKVVCKRLARAAGIPTPEWIAIARPEELPARLPLPWPVIVKPRAQGSGAGIDAGAVVHDRASLTRRLQQLFEQWQEPMLIEAFIPHGELTVCLIGNAPPTAYPAIQRPLDPRNRLSCHVVPSAAGHAWEAPLTLSDSLDAKARHIALQMFETLGCRDLARVDLRVDEQGTVWFLEINPLPSLDPEGSFGLLAEHLGVTYAHLIGRILQAALTRPSVVMGQCDRTARSEGPARSSAPCGAQAGRRPRPESCRFRHSARP